MSTRTTGGRRAGAHPPTANDRFKNRSTRRYLAAFVLATLLHLAVLAILPTVDLEDSPFLPSHTMRSLTLMDPIGPPPVIEPIRRPPSPIAPKPTLPDEVAVPIPVPVIDAPDFDLAFDLTPPPPIAAEAEVGPVDEFSDYEHIVPSMVSPELINRREVQRALERGYPRALQASRIEGTVMVWFWIDEKGEIRKYEIRQSSGHARLDQAAEEVIGIMKFRPAMDRGEAIKVIVALPITFEVR